MGQGLIIRTAFNNQKWAGRCTRPLSDPRCYKCVNPVFFINDKKAIGEDENGICTGNPVSYSDNSFLTGLEPHWCWEQLLVKHHFWGNPLGKWRSAYIGMPVYLVYGGRDNSLTLWGHTAIQEIKNDAEEYPVIVFKPFTVLPEERWLQGLTGKQITGAEWKQGSYRYLDGAHVAHLDSLLKGEQAQPILTESRLYEEQVVGLRPEIRDKLARIADSEGREVEDLIREAVAKLVRDRTK